MKTTAPITSANFWLALVLVFLTTTAATPVARRNVRSIPPPVPQGPFSVSPSSGRAGQVFDVLVSSANPNCATAPGELTNVELQEPEGSPIKVIETTSKAACLITAKIRIPADAPVGKFPLWVKVKDGATLGFVEFTITDFIAPGRIPPGMSPSPAVDVMWSVMPRGIVSDNFGSSIGKQYYAVEIIIGNNSAYNLQLVSVGFELPSDERLEGLLARNAVNKSLTGTTNAASIKNALLAAKSDVKAKLLSNPVAAGDRAATTTLLPTASYKITRGSLEARQALHKRTLILSTITALGPIFTGFTPFFHNINHRGNFTEGINIFSNPLEKGLELVWPDQRPRQRERFDDQVLRDGLIIRNNTQIRTLAFFPKELLRLPRDVEDPTQYNRWKDNAREVRERLGRIVIIGDQIQYVNRISLTSDTPPVVTAPPSVSGLSPNSFIQGDTGQRITISGLNLQGAQLSVSGTTGVHLDKVDVDPNGHFITAEISVDADAPQGTYRINVSTPSSMGTASVEFTVATAPAAPEPAAPTITKFQRNGADVTSGQGGQSIVIFGQNFMGATEVKFGTTSATPLPANLTDTRITITIPASLTTAGEIDVTVTTPGGSSAVKKFTIVAAPSPPG